MYSDSLMSPSTFSDVCTLFVLVCPWNVLGGSLSWLSLWSSRDLGQSMILNRRERRACSYVITLLRVLFALNWWVIDCPLWFGVSKLKKSSSEMAMSFEFWDALWTAWPKLKRCLCWIKPCWFHSFRMSSTRDVDASYTHTHTDGHMA